MNNKITKFVLLSLILLVALALRLYKINIPLADHHSWRQADTAAVARNFVKDKFDFLKPKIDNFIPLHPGVPNNERLFLVEPPIYNSIVALVYKVFGINIVYARLVTILFSLGSLIMIFLLGEYFYGAKVGLLSALFFGILPYGVFYSRVVLPEPMIVFFTLGMFYFCIKWLQSNHILPYSLFIIFSALSFSQKAFPLFFLLPIFFLLWKKFGIKIFFKKELFLWAIISFLPFLLWRFYIGRFPEGIPANLWLFNQDNIRFKGAFFHWIFAERIGKLILGFWGLPLLILGISSKAKKDYGFLILWLIALLAYVFVFASGNVTHDYYQIQLIPLLCLFMGKGAEMLIEGGQNINKTVSRILLAVCLLFTIAFSWYEVRGFYNIQGGVDLAGNAIDEMTPKNSLIITGDSNDATLLYNTNRWGWSAGYASPYPNSEATIKDLITKGASYYVTTKFDKGSDFGIYMLKNYPIIKESNQFIIFNLTNK